MLITIDILPDVSIVMLRQSKSVSLKFRFTNGIFSKEPSCLTNSVSIQKSRIELYR